MAMLDYADGNGSNGASADAPARRKGTKRGNGQGARSPVSIRRIRALERQAQAMELRLAGKSFTDIGAELGVSKQAAWKLVRGAMEVMKEEIAERTDDLRALWAGRLEAIARANMPAALDGDYAAQDRIIKVADRYARLTALDLQPEVAEGGIQVNVIAAFPWERGEGPEASGLPDIEGTVTEGPGPLEAGAVAAPAVEGTRGEPELAPAADVEHEDLSAVIDPADRALT